MENNKKILLVEDDQNFGIVLREFLTLNDFEVTLPALKKEYNAWSNTIITKGL